MLERLAPAKINLFLHVTGRRADGYHLLQSLFAFADIGDRLTFAPDDSFSLEITGPFAGDMPRDGNIIHHAAAALAARYGHRCAGRVVLEKNLPVAAGIGGGSADAAAVLRGLAQLWQVESDDQGLHDIAVTLGADVPACLHTAPLWVEGVGEKITRIGSLPPLYALLVNPRAPTATPAVFRHFAQDFSAPVTPPAGDWVGFLQAQRNDLTAAAQTVTPAIRDVLNALEKTTPLLARLSGSGATCFALYDTKAAAETAAEDIARAHPAWWAGAAALHQT